MAIKKDQEGFEQVKRVLGRRLKASRRAARLSEMQAAVKLNHKGVTQVSLCESGDRIPTLQDLIKYADMYNVPIDFLVGRIDDPIAESDEHNQAIIVRNLMGVLEGNLNLISRSLSEQASACISGHRQERRELKEMIAIVDEIEHAFKRVVEMNPEYEELKGGSTLVAKIKKACEIKANFAHRLELESIQLETIEKALNLEQLESNIKQFQLQLVV